MGYSNVRLAGRLENGKDNCRHIKQIHINPGKYKYVHCSKEFNTSGY